MGYKVCRASVLLPEFQGEDDKRIKLPGIYVEYDDSTPNHIGALVPGIGMIFRCVHEAVESGATIYIGPEVDVDIPPQLLPNIIQHERKVAKYFDGFVAEYPTDLSNVVRLTRDFVPGYLFFGDADEQFLKGMID